LKILIVPDKFKGSMTAREAAQMITEGVRIVFPDADIISRPLSDGGEGLVETMTGGKIEQIRYSKVTGPLGEKVKAGWGLCDNGQTAIIEMSAASGLTLTPGNNRNPSITTTFGTGELIKAALDAGCSRLIIGLGGSATNDGGAGMAAALGVSFKNQKGISLSWGGAQLLNLAKIDVSGLDQRLKGVKTIAACDVDNPLTGPEGASLTYGPQKGATPEMAKQLDRALEHYAGIVKTDLGLDLKKVGGAGAAGGLGAGLIAFLDAELKPGVDLVLDLLKIDRTMAGCNLVITGEGKIDNQSVHGKVPVGVARRASKYAVPVLALTGKLEVDPEILHNEGITASFTIVDGPISLEESIKRGPELIKMKTAELMRFWKAANNNKEPL
jgi:glycerate 2-kinase